jgi:hypothetical protein
MYTIFTRTWWRINHNYPNKLEPKAGRKTYIKEVNTIEEAREFCIENNKNRPSSWLKLSRKYEFTEGHI